MNNNVSVEEKDFELIKTIILDGYYPDLVNRFNIRRMEKPDYSNPAINAFVVRSRRDKELGLDNNDDEIILNAFKKAKRNEEKTKFPDFVFNSGFIEHFEITSSKQGKKGSKQKEEDAKEKREYREEIQDFLNKKPEKLCSPETYSYTYQRKSKHSHENLINSLKKNIEKHNNSQKKYVGSKDVKIYLIHYSDVALTTFEKLSKEDINLDHEQISSNEYLIQYDKEALNALYFNKEYIDYVVFITCFDYRVIKVSKIPELVEKINGEFMFMAGYSMSFYQYFKTSVPFIM